MSRTNTAVLTNFLKEYENPVPYIPNVTNTILISNAPIETPQPLGGITGPAGPTGTAGDKFSSVTQNSVIVTPIIGGVVMFQVGVNLAYIYGTPVYVCNSNISTNNFTGTVLAYNSATGYMTIGNITQIRGTFNGITPYVYTINVTNLVSVGSQGSQGPNGIIGPTGPNGVTGVTGPSVPFSGGSSALILMFQDGFDCGDVD